jgi:small-conductance mechanosensitive channel
MWVAIAGGLFRTFGAMLAGFLVARGQVEASDAETIVGGVGAAAVAIASAYDKVKRK